MSQLAKANDRLVAILYQRKFDDVVRAGVVAGGLLDDVFAVVLGEGPAAAALQSDPED